jgi:hypothetical protein
MDLFDQPPLLQPPSRIALGQAARRAPDPPYRREVRMRIVLGAAISSVVIALVLRFPPVAVVASALIGAGVTVAWRWRWGVTIAIAPATAAFLAQATSIFVTPFTWPLRFGFFLVLLGSLVSLIAWQTKEL